MVTRSLKLPPSERRRPSLDANRTSQTMSLNQSTVRLLSQRKRPMTINKDALREDLRAWTKSPAVGLPEYSADPIVQRRVGRMLANVDAKFLPHAQRKLLVNSIQTSLPDKS